MDKKEQLLIPSPVEDRISSISEEELSFRGWTRDLMRERFLERMRLDLNSPQVGEEAPDFELELLSKNGERSGQKLKLSSLRGKPTGLIFGSYT